MNERLKAIIIGVVAVAAVAVAIVMYRSASNAGGLDHGQVPYTPGVPPWKEKDPAKRGAGGSPPASAPAGNPNIGAPTIGNSGK